MLGIRWPACSHRVAHLDAGLAEQGAGEAAALGGVGEHVGEPPLPGGPPDPVRDGDPIEWLRRHAP